MPKAKKPRARKPREGSLLDQILPTVEDSSSLGMLAASNNLRLVKYKQNGNFNVIPWPECEAQGLLDEDLPSFTPPEHKKLLKSVGYDKVRDHVCIPYGKDGKYTLFVFRLEDSDETMWLTKSGFNTALGKKSYDEKFMNEAASRRSFGLAPSKPHDKGTNEDEANSNDVITKEGEDESDAGNDADDVATIADSDSDAERASEIENQTETDSEDEDNEAPGPSTPRPKGKSPNLGKSSPTPRRSTSIGSRKDKKSAEENIVYARKFGKTLHCLYQKDDGSYDMKPKTSAPTDRIHHEKVLSFAPTIDRQFLEGLTNYDGLNPKYYKLRGCAGFQRGEKQVWKIVVIELTDDKLKEKLGKVREEKRCHYNGPLLCSWTVFEKAIRNDEKVVNKAWKLFEGTELARTYKREGVDPRTIKHKTLEADEFRTVHTKLDQLTEMGKQNAADIQKLIARMAKSKL
ncbi:hypothetical protein T440DRAFT_536439 [Plenodomus tracheiphilus IPT5]|uniref:Uncharacterized protein n=1 Tax=Plenodomus tracheiphilus IPT5 TaxID=1408161 RepID=A0A6A7AYE2_9PLEO|nr:hypothetical protein T440DRAFT_536439 [Plenodomus tracheiphilus IPT5]